MSTRDELFEMLDHAYQGGGFEAFDAEKAEMLDAYRAEVLREAADEAEGLGLDHFANKLRRMADTA